MWHNIAKECIYVFLAEEEEEEDEEEEKEEDEEEEKEEDTEGSAAPTVRVEFQVTDLHCLATPFQDGTRRLAARERLRNRSYQDGRPTASNRLGCVSSLLCVGRSQFSGCAGAWFSSAVPDRSSRGAGLSMGLGGTPDRFPLSEAARLRVLSIAGI